MKNKQQSYDTIFAKRLAIGDIAMFSFVMVDTIYKLTASNFTPNNHVNDIISILGCKVLTKQQQ